MRASATRYTHAYAATATPAYAAAASAYAGCVDTAHTCVDTAHTCVDTAHVDTAHRMPLAVPVLVIGY